MAEETPISKEKEKPVAKGIAEKNPPASEAKGKKKAAENKPVVSGTAGDELWDIIRFPHLSEKSIANIETQNKLVFIVNRKASKKDVKDAVEKIFQVKVVKVNLMSTTKGEKKAFVRLDEKNSAGDIATRLGMM